MFFRMGCKAYIKCLTPLRTETNWKAVAYVLELSHNLGLHTLSRNDELGATATIVGQTVDEVLARLPTNAQREDANTRDRVVFDIGQHLVRVVHFTIRQYKYLTTLGG